MLLLNSLGQSSTPVCLLCLHSEQLIKVQANGVIWPQSIWHREGPCTTDSIPVAGLRIAGKVGGGQGASGGAKRFRPGVQAGREGSFCRDPCRCRLHWGLQAHGWDWQVKSTWWGATTLAGMGSPGELERAGQRQTPYDLPLQAGNRGRRPQHSRQRQAPDMPACSTRPTIQGYRRGRRCLQAPNRCPLGASLELLPN